MHANQGAQSLFTAARKLHQSGDVEAAVKSYRKVLRIVPEYPHASYLLGEALLQLQRPDEAMPPLREATKLRPGHAPSWCALGKSLSALKKTEEAIHAFRQALEADPESKLAAASLRLMLTNSDEFEEAEGLYWEALEKNPFDDTSLTYLIHCLWKGAAKGNPDRFTEAKELAEVAVRRNPNSAGARFSMAHVWMEASCPALAIPEFERALSLQPNVRESRSAYLFNLNYVEDRSNAEIFAAHRKWSELHETLLLPANPTFKNRPDPGRRLKIGYVSPDLSLHPVSYFLQPLLEAHDPSQVEVFVYSNRNENEPIADVTKALQKAAHHWRWVKTLTDAQLVAQIRSDEIDILVDLAGHTKDNRLAAFACRPAPIQISWLGYPNTTGMRSIDYRFSDAIVEPPGEADSFSSEEIVRLPQGFHVFRMPHAFPDPGPPPCVSKKQITFGSFNNLNKVGPRTIELWARLLQRVPHSTLHLKHRSFQVLTNRETLLSRFAMHGIQSHRLILQNRTPTTMAHLSGYNEIDIALDPLAYNGTTTTCEALLMGVPVLTLPGDSHASRVSASLLHRVGLDGWIAENEEHFLSIGAGAAQATQTLAALRSQLRQAFLDSPLSNGPALAGNIEKAYREMWTRWCSTSTSPTKTGSPSAPQLELSTS